MNAITGQIAEGQGTVGQLVPERRDQQEPQRGARRGEGGRRQPQRRDDEGQEAEPRSRPARRVPDESRARARASSRSTLAKVGEPRFYRLELSSEPFGVRRDTTTITTTTFPDGHTETVRQDQAEFKDTIAISAEVGYRLGNWIGRAGVIQNSGGAGIDYLTLKDRLRFSAEMWDFGRRGRPEPPREAHRTLLLLARRSSSSEAGTIFLNTKANRDSLFLGAGRALGRRRHEVPGRRRVLEARGSREHGARPDRLRLSVLRRHGAEVAGALSGLRRLEFLRRGGPDQSRPRVRRRASASQSVPIGEIASLDGPRRATGHAGIRPRARRRARGGLGRASRRRAGHRQVHAAPPGRARPRGRRLAATCSTRAPRSPRRRSVCGPSGWAFGTAACSCCRRRTSRASSPRPRRERPPSRSSWWIPSRPCADPTLASSPGTVSQVRAAAGELTRYAKTSGVPVLLVGHVTKDGSLAGPKSLEHLVDAVVSIEGDRGGARRLLRATKNRFGPVDEIALYEMTGEGLAELPDASAALLAERRAGLPGSAVTAAREGTRSVLVEIQALVGGVSAGSPRRVAIGVDGGRLALLIAVLEGAGLPLSSREVFVSCTGGIEVSEPAADLAIVAALASSARGPAAAGAQRLLRRDRPARRSAARARGRVAPQGSGGARISDDLSAVGQRGRRLGVSGPGVPARGPRGGLPGGALPEILLGRRRAD